MKKANIIFFPLLLILCVSCSKDPDEFSKINDSDWQLVWSDEFSHQGKPDSSKWMYDIGGHGWGNVEEQYFTDRLKNAEVRDGKLFITADEEEYENRYYTSARLKTHGLAQWLNGRFEIYAKLAPGQGTCSAFWLLPHNYYEKANWPGCGEIDIMENVGQMPDTIHGTVHTMKYNHMRGTHKSGTITTPDCYREFHLYAMEWTTSEIICYFDEKEYFSYVKEADSINVWPFNVPFSLIISLSLGGGFG